METLAIVQLVAAIFMKGLIRDLLGLYFTLQIIIYMQTYDTPTPSNTEIYNLQFKDMIEFKMLKPNSILQLILDDEDPLSQHCNWPVIDRPAISCKMNIGIHVLVYSSGWIGVKFVAVVFENVFAPYRNQECKQQDA